MKNLTFLIFLLSGIFVAASSYADYQFLLTPKLSLTEEYTDNLFLSNINKEDDFITVISPGIVARLWDRTSDITLEYSPGYSMYRTFSEYDTLRHNARLYGRMAFSRHTRLTFRNDLLVTEDPVAKTTYPSTQPDGTSDGQDTTKPPEPLTPQAERQKIREEIVRKSRKQYLTDTTETELTHQFGKADLLSLKYRYHILDNEDESIENEATHNPSVNFAYWLIPNRFGIRAGAAYVKSDFSETTTNTAYREESISPTFGLTYRISKNFTVDTGISYRKGEFTDPVPRDSGLENTQSDEESLNPTFGLTYRIPAYKLDLTLSLSYMRGGFSDPTKDFENRFAMIKLGKQFTPRLTGFFRYAHTIMTFAGGGEESYDIYDPSVGITYLLADKIPMTLSVGYFTRDKESGDKESAMSLNGDIGKSWTFGRTTINFSGTSGYDQSYFGAKALGFGLFYDLKSAVRHSFSKDMAGDMFASYRKDRYLDLKATRDDETREAGAGITWLLFRKWLSARLGYTYRDVLSTLSENSHTENRISLTLSVSDPRLLRYKP